METNNQSDEFIAGPVLNRALDGLYEQLKGLLINLDLARKP